MPLLQPFIIIIHMNAQVVGDKGMLRLARPPEELRYSVITISDDKWLQAGSTLT
jgi:hypothetical protein